MTRGFADVKLPSGKTIRIKCSVDVFTPMLTVNPEADDFTYQLAQALADIIRKAEAPVGELTDTDVQYLADWFLRRYVGNV